MKCHGVLHIGMTYITDGFVFRQHLNDSDYVNSFTEKISRKHMNEDRIRYAWDQFLILGKI